MSTVNGFQVGSETLKYNYESLDNYNTPNFSTSSSETYAVGDYVMYNGKLYKCTTATTGGTWVSGNWTEAVLSDDVGDLSRHLNDKQDAPSTSGIAGQVLGLDNSLHPVWVNQSGGGGGGSGDADGLRLILLEQLIPILQAGVYTSDQSDEIMALMSALQEGGITPSFSNNTLTLSGFESTPSWTIS